MFCVTSYEDEKKNCGAEQTQDSDEEVWKIICMLVLCVVICEIFISFFYFVFFFLEKYFHWTIKMENSSLHSSGSSLSVFNLGNVRKSKIPRSGWRNGLKKKHKSNKKSSLKSEILCIGKQKRISQKNARCEGVNTRWLKNETYPKFTRYKISSKYSTSRIIE